MKFGITKNQTINCTIGLLSKWGQLPTKLTLDKVDTGQS